MRALEIILILVIALYAFNMEEEKSLKLPLLALLTAGYIMHILRIRNVTNVNKLAK